MAAAASASLDWSVDATTDDDNASSKRSKDALQRFRPLYNAARVAQQQKQRAAAAAAAAAAKAQTSENKWAADDDDDDEEKGADATTNNNKTHKPGILPAWLTPTESRHSSWPSNLTQYDRARCYNVESILKQFPVTLEADSKEATVLAAFKAQLSTELRALNVSDHTYLRFLRARKFKVDKAMEMYVAQVAWRKAERVDAILDAPDVNESIYRACCPHAHHGWDRQGRPVYIERTGMARMGKFLAELKEQDLIDRHVRSVEHIIQHRMIESSLRHGRLIGKQVIIMDLKKLSWSPDRAGLRVFKATLKIDQLYCTATLVCGSRLCFLSS
jgi:hypothetical protein